MGQAINYMLSYSQPSPSLGVLIMQMEIPATGDIDPVTKAIAHS